MENKKLEVGDVIFKSGNYGTTTRRLVIDRVTEKYACVEDEMFDRITLRKRGSERGRWSDGSADRWTQRLQDLYDAQMLNIKKTNIGQKIAHSSTVLTLDQLSRINAILQENTNVEKKP